jgi:ubiquinone/menaquinone biosynthesis C-methylase UbiE
MLPRAFRAAMIRDYPLAHGALSVGDTLDPFPGEEDPDFAIKRRTVDSFAYEWSHFGGLREQWQRNFLDYMRPLERAWFADRYVLDVGAGSGRHSFHAAKHGAHVVAVDLGASIDVARRNLPSEVLTVQADAERLPFARESFDLVMSIGVLHHLPQPERALERLVPLARPGGHVHVYLYWVPEHAGHASVLRLVTAARRMTVHLPHRLLHALSLPLSAALMAGIVAPYRALRRRPRGHRIAEALPLKTYADYPFAVLVNDQFDRFSAPLERRFTRKEVESMLTRAHLEHVRVIANNGWIGDGTTPAPESAGTTGLVA